MTLLGRDFNTWRIYTLVCSIPALLGLITISLLPESPKYLLSKGSSERALRLLRRMYAVNSGKPADTFPVHFHFSKSIYVYIYYI